VNGYPNRISAVAVQPDGKVLIGGDITAINGTNRQHIARLQANGSLDNSFNPGTGPDARVRSIVLQPDGKMVIGGEFTTVNGAVRPYVARLLGDPPPELSITLANGIATLSWPASASNLQLQESADLGLTGWLPVLQTVVNTGTEISVTVPASAGRKFFRLKAP
jgi:hypothetical protein